MRQMRRVKDFAVRKGCPVALAVLVSGCSSSMCETTASYTSDSPAGSFSAHVTETDCGATTPVSTRVSVSKAGLEPTRKDIVFRGAGLADFDFAWRTESHLELTYRSGRVYEFRSFWLHTEEGELPAEVLVTESRRHEE